MSRLLLLLFALLLKPGLASFVVEFGSYPETKIFGGIGEPLFWIPFLFRLEICLFRWGLPRLAFIHRLAKHWLKSVFGFCINLLLAGCLLREQARLFNFFVEIDFGFIFVSSCRLKLLLLGTKCFMAVGLRGGTKELTEHVSAGEHILATTVIYVLHNTRVYFGIDLH